MSQRECSGFNTPAFPVTESEDIEGEPITSFAVDCRSIPPDPRVSFDFLDSGPRSLVFGVGHPPNALADVGRRDARSAQIGGPDCISQCFQVSTYSGEPSTSKFARNLLSKDDWRIEEGEESSHFGPEVTFVGFALLLARVRERLAGTRAGPDGAIIGPPGKSKSVGPSADAREEVNLSKADKISLRELLDVALVNHARWNVTFADQFAQPCGGVGVVFVVEVHRTPRSSTGRDSGEGRKSSASQPRPMPSASSASAETFAPMPMNGSTR